MRNRPWRGLFVLAQASKRALPPGVMKNRPLKRWKHRLRNYGGISMPPQRSAWLFWRSSTAEEAGRIASCSHWLNWQCGISRVAAREKVRTARALESLPKIAAAFGEGRLSYSKVRALTRAATSATEDTLLHIALNGTAAHVERTVRGFRRVRRHLEREEAEAMHERRYLNCRRESDGSVRVDARLAPEVGEMPIKALEAAEAELDERDEDKEHSGVSAETPPRPAARRGWRSSTRRGESTLTPGLLAASGAASAWTTTSPSTDCAGRRDIRDWPRAQEDMDCLRNRALQAFSDSNVRLPCGSWGGLGRACTGTTSRLSAAPSVAMSPSSE